VRPGPEGVTTEHALSLTHEQLAEGLGLAGFRFPKPDEWEYACGRGEPTLFRWGDHVPCDRYPTDISPAEWSLSAGKLEYPTEGFVSDWDDHRQPNAFGLVIAYNPSNLS
jgi:formylglycine-generating enzyme required for sulfatase activity